MTGAAAAAAAGAGGGACAPSGQAEKYPFHTGSILKVRLHNFLTYSDAEVTPGSRLNMVVGPNGSGKSTILCAIALGLGSNYTALERAGSVGEYVMRDKEKGWVELTLKGKGHDQAVKIRRDLERNSNKSKWRLDDEPATMACVQKVVKELGVEVNNLCTFLPQEKVGQFTEMNPGQLLQETEKSLTKTDLYETHLKLIEMEESMRSADKDRGTAEAELEKKEALLAALARSKEQVENRDRLLAKAATYDKVALSLEFKKTQFAGARAKAETKALEEELQVARAKVQPFTERVAVFKEGAAAANKAQNRAHAAYERAKAAAMEEGDGVEAKHDALQQVKGTLKTLAAQRERQERQRREVQTQLDAAIKLRDEADVDELKKQLGEVNKVARKAKQEYEVQSAERGAKLREQEDARRDEAEAKAKVEGLQGLATRRVRHLQNQVGGKFQHARDAVRAYQWVQQNLRRFSGRVFGPIALDVSVDSDEHAAMVEAQLPGHVLLSFVVENEKDKEVLMTECKDNQNLKIAVTELPERWQEDVNKEYYTAEDLQGLRSKGVVGLMEKAIQAPPQVMAALRNICNVHRVMLGNAEAERLMGHGLMEELCATGGSGPLAGGGGGRAGGDDEDRKGSAVLYTLRAGGQGGIVQHRGAASRYSGKVSTQSRMVERARVLGNFQADEQQDALVRNAQQALDTARKRLSDLAIEIVEVTEKDEAAGKQKSRLEKEVKQLKEDVNKALGAKEKVKRLTATLQKLEADLQVDAGAQREQLQQQTQLAARALVDATVGVGDAVEALVGSWVARAPPKLAHSAALKLQQQAEREQRAAAERHQELADRFEAKRKQMSVLMAALKKQKDEVTKRMVRDDDAATVKELLDTEYNVQGNQTENEGPEEACERLQLQCLAEKEAAEEEAGRIVDNPEALRQYEVVSKEVAALKKRHAQLQRACDSGQTDLERLAGPWADNLKNLTKRLTERFGEYMEQMGCEGKVTLDGHGGDGEKEDYGAWRLQIWVKFRKETTLQPLSAKVHSGGERSVSTILFLMGLQDFIGPSPFRAVDEINQGMDERNERLVFSRIVANSTKNQYFFVTPKLLPGLTAMEMDHVTVLFVFNAPELFPFDRWDINAFIHAVARRQCALGTSTGGGSAGGSAGGGKSKKRRNTGGGDEEEEEEEEEDKADDSQDEGRSRGGKKRRSEGEATRA